MKAIAAGIIVLVVAFVVFAVATYDPSGAAIAERIQKGCEREYGAGTSAATSCRLRATAEALGKIEADRYERATSGIRR